MRTRVLLLLPLLLIAAPVAIASAKPFEIGFGGGATVPLSHTKDAFKTGWHGKGIVNLNIPMLPVGLSGSFTYHHFSLEETPGAPGLSGSGRIMAGMANATIGLPIPGPIKPYITAGIGEFNIKADPDSSGVETESTTKFGIDGGAGLRISIPGTGIHAFIEGKIQNIYTDKGVNSAVINNFKTQIVPVTFGIFL
jgi:opacity protein-like surface antigen